MGESQVEEGAAPLAAMGRINELLHLLELKKGRTEIEAVGVMIDFEPPPFRDSTIRLLLQIKVGTQGPHACSLLSSGKLRYPNDTSESIISPYSDKILWAVEGALRSMALAEATYAFQKMSEQEERYRRIKDVLENGGPKA